MKMEVLQMAEKAKIEEEILEIIHNGTTTKVKVAEKIIESRNIESFEAYEIIDSMVNDGQLIKKNETVGDYDINIT